MKMTSDSNERPMRIKQAGNVQAGRQTAAGRRKAKAFTLIELLVVIAIISLLVSILLPSLNRAKELAKKAVCLSNLHHVSLSYAMYRSESNGRFSDVTMWFHGHNANFGVRNNPVLAEKLGELDLLDWGIPDPYIGESERLATLPWGYLPDIWICPSGRDTPMSDYGSQSTYQTNSYLCSKEYVTAGQPGTSIYEWYWNGYCALSDDQVTYSAGKVAVVWCGCTTRLHQINGTNVWHNGGKQQNFVFLDGHGEANYPENVQPSLMNTNPFDVGGNPVEPANEYEVIITPRYPGE